MLGDFVRKGEDRNTEGECHVKMEAEIGMLYLQTKKNVKDY